jgi:hypothetical protein
MTRRPKESALTASEERILRSTIDDTQIFEVPVRTVKKLLALLDVERGQVKPPVATPVPTLAFVTNPAHHEIFYMRTTAGDVAIDDLFTRAEAAAFLRARFEGRQFNVPAVSATSGAEGVVTREVGEIADMLERGDLP